MIVALFTPSLSYAKDLKIGFIDILLIFNEYTKSKDYEKVLDEQRKQKEDERGLTEKKEEIIKMQDKLSLLKEKEQEKQKEKIRDAYVEYRNIENQILTDMKKESDTKINEILSDINKTIKNYGQKNGFDLILNKGAVVYGEEGIEITDAVLKILNKEYKK